MTALTWDDVGLRLYETGVDHGVLYMPDSSGAYIDGVAWNGLTTVTESPGGAEANPQYADNIKYLNLYSAETFEATIEAFTYPAEFMAYDGLAVPVPGVTVGQQMRKTFGLSYRTQIGNDLDGTDHGYKLHLLYGCTASPSEKAYNTINDSPEAITFSWALNTIPVSVTGLKPTASMTIDSTLVDPSDLADLQLLLYGSSGIDPQLPLPDEVIAVFGSGLTEVTATTPPFVQATGVITIPTVTGVQYRRSDNNAVVTGTVTIPTSGASQGIKAKPITGYMLSATSDDDWVFTRS